MKNQLPQQILYDIMILNCYESEELKMFFEHENIIKKDGCFFIHSELAAKGSHILNKSIFREFWFGHTFGYSELKLENTTEFIFSAGNTKKYELNGYDYVIAVEPNGIFIVAKDEKNLIYGFMTMLDRITTDENGNISIPCCEIRENPIIEKRMIHFCLFPDTQLWELEKFVRFCGALKYSHIILEFWGMFKYDCLKELAWEHAFTKEQIKPILNQANDLGIEIIPMFNHWGHASQSRVMHGKHVILNQNPKLAYLFGDDGWCWNIKSEKVKKLLKNIRHELVELCGGGEYFHIGCDEAYGFEYTKEEIDSVTAFINETNADITYHGRKTVMWADMLIYKYENYNKNNIYTASSPSKKVSSHIMTALDKNIIMADWQYDCKEFPIETAVDLQKSGFEVLLCPWDRSAENIDACVNTVIKYNLNGILHTTWHTLSGGTPRVAQTAALCWESDKNMPWSFYASKSAAIMRKTYFTGGNYEKSGWAKYEIGVET